MTVAIGASCTVDVRLAPTGVGRPADTLLLNYDDGTGPATTVSKEVSGTGVQFSVPAIQRAGLLLLGA